MSELATLEDVEKILYIPTWLYSNDLGSLKKCSSVSFTFQPGYIQIYLDGVCV